MSTDHLIFMVCRWLGELAPKGERRRVRFLSQIAIEELVCLQTRFLLGRQSVLRSKTSRRIVLVLVVPVACDLTVVSVELLVVIRCAGDVSGNEKCDSKNYSKYVDF